MLIKHCLEGIVPDIIEGLQDGPPGGEPPADLVERSRWFQSLQPADQKQVEGVIEESLDLCLFHLLNILDSTSPISPMEQFSDFAVYLQTYASDEDLDRNEPRTAVRVNPVVPAYEEGSEQLHDIFSELRDETPE